MPLSPGSRLGPYEVLSPLGAGGMGSEEVKEIAWKAHRLSSRYRRLVAKGKLHQKAVTAVGRELLGFVWAIGMQVEKEQRVRAARAQAA